MSICKTNIVNNDILCESIRYLGFDKFLRHNNSYFTFDGPKLQKATGYFFNFLLIIIS